MVCQIRPQAQAALDTQGDLNLNICEAHAFNTLDKFSLDVFVVNGWKGQVGIPHTQSMDLAAFLVSCVLHCVAAQLLHTCLSFPVS